MSDRPITTTGKERVVLRGRVHGDKPVAQIGKAGLEASVIEAVDQALTAREVIKVRIGRSCPLEPKVAADRLATALEAEVVGRAGAVAILYRPRREESAPR